MKPVALSGGAAIAVLTLSLSLTLAGCDGKSSAVSGRDSGAATSLASDGRGRATDPRDLPVPQIGGKPLWAANRTHTAEENAQFQFSKNGGDFAARSESDYVIKAHAFIEKPPRGVETLDRPNGDRLIYDPKGNTFAVIAKNGAPRTMFKPKGGGAYWDQQKERESKRSKAGQDRGGSDQS